jgi:hypothetical protein
MRAGRAQQRQRHASTKLLFKLLHLSMHEINDLRTISKRAKTLEPGNDADKAKYLQNYAHVIRFRFLKNVSASQNGHTRSFSTQKETHTRTQ